MLFSGLFIRRTFFSPKRWGVEFYETVKSKEGKQETGKEGPSSASLLFLEDPPFIWSVRLGVNKILKGETDFPECFSKTSCLHLRLYPKEPGW